MSSRELLPVGRRLRLGLGLVIAAILALATLSLAFAGYGHIAGRSVRLKIAVEHEIVQVFVDCRLAHTAYLHDPETTLLDLGWLPEGRIVTIQIRGRKGPGFYEVSMEQGGAFQAIAYAGRFGAPVAMASGRLLVSDSFTGGGVQLGKEGCQPDAPSELPIAAAADRDPRAWRSDLPEAVISASERSSGVVASVLALSGALALLVLAVNARLKGSGAKWRALAALGDILLVVVLAFVVQDFAIAVVVCAIAGVCSLTVALWSLVGHDVTSLRRESSGKK